MSDQKYVVLLYQKDFLESGNDRYFIYEEGEFSEVDSDHLVSTKCTVITHDFWLISNSIYKINQTLPKNILDVVLLEKILQGSKSQKGDTQSWDVSKTIKPIYSKPEDFDKYIEIYYRRKSFDFDTYMLFAHKLSEHFDNLKVRAEKAGEFDRFYQLEMPIYNLLSLAACKGIKVDNKKIREHKEKIQLEFYRELKRFSEKHSVFYEIPTEEGVREKLEELNYQTKGHSLDYLINLLPSKNGYTNDLRRLQKIEKSYRVFNSISSGSNRLRPIVESHSTSTSRIYHRSPSIQNIAKKYRDIFIADAGRELCYVDYDQFEVGIMASISGDQKMKKIYESSDAYEDLASTIFCKKSMRKSAKTLFLSYTYGMSMENIKSSIRELSGDEKKATEYFSEFNTFESWKNSIHDQFLKERKIGTISGNFLYRKETGDLTEKEKRSSVSHIIQGTASYIFKKALLKLFQTEGAEVLIPMHDAVLIQHTNKFNKNQAIEIFESVMTELLPGIYGKASIENFFVKDKIKDG